MIIGIVLGIVVLTGLLSVPQQTVLNEPEIVDSAEENVSLDDILDEIEEANKSKESAVNANLEKCEECNKVPEGPGRQQCLEAMKC